MCFCGACRRRLAGNCNIRLQPWVSAGIGTRVIRSSPLRSSAMTTRSIRRPLFRTLLATALVALLGACTVVPAGHVGYRSGPVYVDSYPAYRSYPGTTTYYYYDNDRHGYRGHDRGYERRYDERRYDDRPSRSMPLPPPLQLHRDVRRSLGLPRLPGMP